MSKPAQPTPREIRRKSGRNQSAFWGPLGVTQSGGSRYETGRAVPKPVQILLTLAHGTEKEAAALFNRLRGRE